MTDVRPPSSDYSALVERVAGEKLIDPLLVEAMIHVESRARPGAISHKGARGLMQVMPATARGLGFAGDDSELHDPFTSVELGTAYLRVLHKRFGNDLPLVVAAYNAGEGAVEKYGRQIPPYRETQGYVRDVLARYEALRAAAAQGAR
ncbi:lytic transglycosylase domain-containing protein [Pacificimonas sp. WHA3]|uniref:Lytic transglycosylase domain-containing protein n=1 Tax=Pacificimonas pallii TaxID=2827236 RepID=A0ABS6SEX4_9SPHN|nr:lytic transglycosylase domain-containing protein [Pacificimonas pallii]